MEEFFHRKVPCRNSKPHKLPSFSLLFSLLIIFINFKTSFCSSSFAPADNYLIDCGSSQQTKLSDGRTFKSERDTASLLSSADDVHISADDSSVSPDKLANYNNNSSMTVPPSSLPLFTTLRVFTEESTYSFHISQPGTHFVRLYFLPIPHATYNLTTATFGVTADDYVVLEDFSVSDFNTFVYKEYLVNASERFSLVFKPKKKSFAFVNAIEVVSAPDSLVPDSAMAVFPSRDVSGISSNYALQVSYRLNVGGPLLGPANDTLYRTWESDSAYNVFVQGSKSVSVSPKTVKYPVVNGDLSLTPLIAPSWVYASAQQMQDPVTLEPTFNLTWRFSVDKGYSYLIRMHFCDIVSLALNTLYFNVYINEMTAVSSLDLSSLTGALATAYYKDFVLDSANITNSTIMIQVGCANLQSGVRNAILNGLEIVKMSNSAGSLNGTFTVDGKYKGPGSRFGTMKIVAAVGLGLAATAMFLVGMVCVRWHKRPQGWEKRKSFSSWLLPLHAGYSSTNYWSSRSSSRRSSLFGSRRSKSGYSSYFPSSVCFGRVFTLGELQAATQNFDEKAVVGVGGFGKVYLGVLEDGTKLAIKRGNPSSEQGINEFKTEIEMLSKLRHRHLVSLIGFCDEQSEMILVYEYMSNGPFRDHLYGSNLPSLSWKQRLDICIGSARGLHYLHTGAAQGIIHRDVKTTNILLDENFVAKVADFGLSKAAPSLDKTHVSTAVKGSFGYLDPEYFRRQQLTEKSDVYSFGVVLFEALCARTVIDPKLPRDQVSLAEWAMHWHRKGMIEKIIDPHIASTINSESLKKFVEAAEKCLAEYGVDRPSMGDVLWNLEYSLQLQEAASALKLEDKSECVIVGMEKIASGGDSKEGLDVVEINDDSNVTVEGSSLFSQMGHFQGR